MLAQMLAHARHVDYEKFRDCYREHNENYSERATQMRARALRGNSIVFATFNH